MSSATADPQSMAGNGRTRGRWTHSCPRAEAQRTATPQALPMAARAAEEQRPTREPAPDAGAGGDHWRELPESSARRLSPGRRADRFLERWLALFRSELVTGSWRWTICHDASIRRQLARTNCRGWRAGSRSSCRRTGMRKRGATAAARCTGSTTGAARRPASGSSSSSIRASARTSSKPSGNAACGSLENKYFGPGIRYRAGAAAPDGMIVPGLTLADPDYMGLRGDYYVGIDSTH